VDRLNEVFTLNQDYVLQAGLQDKYHQYELAVSFDIPTPATWAVDEQFLREKPDLPFPMLVKERRGKKLFRATGRQAFEVSSWEELENMISGVSENADGLLVQEKITDHGQEHMYSIGSYCGHDREPRALFSMKRLRSTRPFGSSALSESAPCPEGEELADRFLRHLRYYGNCEIEFIYDSERGQFLFLEINNRLYKIHSLATHCGINLSYLALLDAMGKTGPPLPEQIYGPRWWLMWYDIAAGVRRMMSGEMSFQQLMAPLSFDFVNGIDELDDPLPGFVNLFRGKF
jgi:predicted ATP-grasp superfamily ATP-dependent carboligase